MASAVATGVSRETVPAPSDGPTRTMWRDAELEAIAVLDAERRGKRAYSNFLLNMRRTGAVLRKLDAAGGNGTASTVQLARHLYADVGEAWDRAQLLRAEGDEPAAEAAYLDAYDLAMNKRGSIVRWLRVLSAQGVISYQSINGKGFRWSFRPVPEQVARMASARGCSSVGWSYSDGPHGGRSRRENAAQAPAATRVRRWCPRAGRGAAYEPPPAPRRPLFSPERFGTPRAPLKGGNDNSGADAHERVRIRSLLLDAGLGTARRDALDRACPPNARAALDSLRSQGNEGGVAALRAAAVAEPVPWSALALATWSTVLPGVEPRCSVDTAAMLDRSGEQLARLWGREAAVGFVVGQLDGLQPDGTDPLTGNQLHTIKVVALVLRHVARDARRKHRRAPAPRPHRGRGDGSL